MTSGRLPSRHSSNRRKKGWPSSSSILLLLVIVVFMTLHLHYYRNDNDSVNQQQNQGIEGHKYEFLAKLSSISSSTLSFDSMQDQFDFNWEEDSQSNDADDDGHTSSDESQTPSEWFERENDDDHKHLSNSFDNDANSREGESGKIAWLMSFPNSGTSFTSLLIRDATNTTTASNYGAECRPGADGKSVPVYEWSPKGPYWLHPPDAANKNSDAINDNDADERTMQQLDSTINDMNRSRSESDHSYVPTPPEGASILTKTHCGGRCTFCSPRKYLETMQSFMKMCLSGARSVPIQETDVNKVDAALLRNVNPGYKKEFVVYHPSIVERAIHIIRDPFDNLVSRFHHEQKEHKKRHDTKWTQRYPNDVKGFRKWCADEDRMYRNEEQIVNWNEWGYSSDEISMLFESVGCHAEFYRYIQWHNLAVNVVQNLNIPVMYVFYEEYLTDLEGTADRMLKFLNITRVGTLPSFYSNKNYSEYFTHEERAAASALMKRLANDDSKALISGYLVKLDFAALKNQIQSITD